MPSLETQIAASRLDRFLAERLLAQLETQVTQPMPQRRAPPRPHDGSEPEPPSPDDDDEVDFRLVEYIILRRRLLQASPAITTRELARFHPARVIERARAYAFWGLAMPQESERVFLRLAGSALTAIKKAEWVTEAARMWQQHGEPDRMAAMLNLAGKFLPEQRGMFLALTAYGYQDRRQLEKARSFWDEAQAAGLNPLRGLAEWYVHQGKLAEWIEHLDDVQASRPDVSHRMLAFHRSLAAALVGDVRRAWRDGREYSRQSWEDEAKVQSAADAMHVGLATEHRPGQRILEPRFIWRCCFPDPEAFTQDEPGIHAIGGRVVAVKATQDGLQLTIFGSPETVVLDAEGRLTRASFYSGAVRMRGAANGVAWALACPDRSGPDRVSHELYTCVGSDRGCDRADTWSLGPYERHYSLPNVEVGADGVVYCWDERDEPRVDVIDPTHRTHAIVELKGFGQIKRIDPFRRAFPRSFLAKCHHRRRGDTLGVLCVETIPGEYVSHALPGPGVRLGNHHIACILPDGELGVCDGSGTLVSQTREGDYFDLTSQRRDLVAIDTNHVGYMNGNHFILFRLNARGHLQRVGQALASLEGDDELALIGLHQGRFALLKVHRAGLFVDLEAPCFLRVLPGVTNPDEVVWMERSFLVNGVSYHDTTLLEIDYEGRQLAVFPYIAAWNWSLLPYRGAVHVGDEHGAVFSVELPAPVASEE